MHVSWNSLKLAEPHDNVSRAVKCPADVVTTGPILLKLQWFCEATFFALTLSNLSILLQLQIDAQHELMYHMTRYEIKEGK